MRKRPEFDLPEKTVADRLYRLRMIAGLTQEELCAKIEYTSNYYGQVERGAIKLSRKLAEKLRAFYKTTLEYLYFGPDDHVSEDNTYSRHPIYELVENCSEEERDMLYDMARSVIRNFRDYKAEALAQISEEKGNH